MAGAGHLVAADHHRLRMARGHRLGLGDRQPQGAVGRQLPLEGIFGHPGRDGRERQVQPLEQAAAIVARSSEKQLARAFLDFIKTPEGRSIFNHYGFAKPAPEKKP